MIEPPNGQLRFYMNLMALDSLPGTSTGPHQGGFRERLQQIREAGFQGVQFATPATAEQVLTCSQLGLGFAGSGRVNNPKESSALAEQLSGDGYECVTLHAGWGMEDDDEADRLIESIIEASQRWNIPFYVETHRATIFQDMWRTVQFIRRFPEIRINGDFSHWYTGQEMVYGGFENKFAFIAPVLERVRFIHGRIGNPGCIQVRIEPDPAEEPVYVGHFRQLWTACFRGFLRTARPHDYICFTPELLAPGIYYARTISASAISTSTLLTSDGPVEESDRWQQSLLLNQIAQSCFAEARA